MSELADLFAREFPIWHMVARGTVVYWFLLLVFRFVLRRDVGSMGVAHLLFVVLVADAASNAMNAGGTRMPDPTTASRAPMMHTT